MSWRWWRSLRESNPSFQIEKPDRNVAIQRSFRKNLPWSRNGESKTWPAFRNDRLSGVGTRLYGWTPWRTSSLPAVRIAPTLHHFHHYGWRHSIQATLNCDLAQRNLASPSGCPAPPTPRSRPVGMMAHLLDLRQAEARNENASPSGIPPLPIGLVRNSLDSHRQGGRRRLS